VRGLNLPGVRLMVDTFHMNLERDMIAQLAAVADILVHVHLSETNRDVLAQDTGTPAPRRTARCRGTTDAEETGEARSVLDCYATSCVRQ
jgi:sugar phosphate isomerase/epimerase